MDPAGHAHDWAAGSAQPLPGSPHSGRTQQAPGRDLLRQARPARRQRGAPGQSRTPTSAGPHRDAQRVEELCAKNHQLREQQKALKENVRVLENR